MLDCDVDACPATFVKGAEVDDVSILEQLANKMIFKIAIDL
jgi:hypothetical protein